MQIFKVSHSMVTKVSREAIWSLWSDINNWPKWDVGLTECKSTAEFKVGNSFELTPKNAPKAVIALLTEVVPNYRFSDKTNLDFATIEAIHEIQNENAGITVTHTIIVKVQDEKADFFKAKIWPGFENGLPESVKNLILLAEKNEANKIN